MPRGTTVEAADGSAVVVTTATGADAVGLRAAGERLRAAAHPGVVEVVSSSGSDDSWELRLVHAGRPLDTVGTLPPEQVAVVAAGVAATLADLHAARIVHGRIDASHVLLGSHGRPVLCGFGDGAPAGATPADDVAMLGALIVTLLGADAELEPIPEHRWRRRVGSTGVRRTLLLLADQAAAEPASRRPTARRLAAAISEAHPDVVRSPASGAPHATTLVDPLPAPVDPADPLDALRATTVTAPQTPRLPALACALAGVIVLGAGGLRLARTEAPSSRAGSAAAVSTTARPASAVPDRDLPPTTAIVSSPPTPCVHAPDVSGAAGCAPVAIHGTTVVVGERRYEVGEPGDLVVAGDWDCDGAPTPALLRPSTGEVFAFASWAVDGDVVVRAIDQVDGAARLLTEPGDDGCTILIVERVDGSSTRVMVGDA